MEPKDWVLSQKKTILSNLQTDPEFKAKVIDAWVSQQLLKIQEDPLENEVFDNGVLVASRHWECDFKDCSFTRFRGNATVLAIKVESEDTTKLCKKKKNACLKHYQLHEKSKNDYCHNFFKKNKHLPVGAFLNLKEVATKQKTAAHESQKTLKPFETTHPSTSATIQSTTITAIEKTSSDRDKHGPYDKKRPLRPNQIIANSSDDSDSEFGETEEPAAKKSVPTKKDVLVQTISSSEFDETEETAAKKSAPTQKDVFVQTISSSEFDETEEPAAKKSAPTQKDVLVQTILSGTTETNEVSELKLKLAASETLVGTLSNQLQNQQKTIEVLLKQNEDLIKIISEKQLNNTSKASTSKIQTEKVLLPTLEEINDLDNYLDRVLSAESSTAIIKMIPPKEWSGKISEEQWQKIFDKKNVRAKIQNHEKLVDGIHLMTNNSTKDDPAINKACQKLKDFHTNTKCSEEQLKDLSDTELFKMCLEKLSVQDPKTKKGLLGYYGADLHWSAFDSKLKGGNLSKLNSLLHQKIENAQVQIFLVNSCFKQSWL